jgi:hypothetical protein
MTQTPARISNWSQTEVLIVVATTAIIGTTVWTAPPKPECPVVILQGPPTRFEGKPQYSLPLGKRISVTLFDDERNGDEHGNENSHL